MRVPNSYNFVKCLKFCFLFVYQFIYQVINFLGHSTVKNPLTMILIKTLGENVKFIWCCYILLSPIIRKMCTLLNIFYRIEYYNWNKFGPEIKFFSKFYIITSIHCFSSKRKMLKCIRPALTMLNKYSSLEAKVAGSNPLRFFLAFALHVFEYTKKWDIYYYTFCDVYMRTFFLLKCLFNQ